MPRMRYILLVILSTGTNVFILKCLPFLEIESKKPHFFSEKKRGYSFSIHVSLDTSWLVCVIFAVIDLVRYRGIELTFYHNR